MKKFIEVESGKEINLNDIINLKVKVNTPLGDYLMSKDIIVTKYVLQNLILSKKVKIVDTDDYTEYNAVWDAALISLSKKTGWKLEKINNILSTLDSVNPWATLQFVLREIAIEIDKKYKDSNITKSDEIYVISPQDGCIHRLDKSTIKTYKTFPAFRTMADARIVYNLVKEHLTNIFHV